ncbi:hypothetical protein [Magnetovibrio sp.]|uniref:hypothetical protein n=1 Tax=Magnetovibrio sp. TaxID=2024836 RepID=UPI002F93D319
MEQSDDTHISNGDHVSALCLGVHAYLSEHGVCEDTQGINGLVAYANLPELERRKWEARGHEILTAPLPLSDASKPSAKSSFLTALIPGHPFAKKHAFIYLALIYIPLAYLAFRNGPNWQDASLFFGFLFLAWAIWRSSAFGEQNGGPKELS